MRVTSLGSSAAAAISLNAAASRVQSASQDLSTGRRIRTVADSPTDSATVLRYNAHQSALTAHETAAHDAQAWLASTDTALQSTSAAVMSAMTTIQAAGSPAMDATSREALANQVDALASQLFDLANATAQGRSLFGGFVDQAVTRNPDGTVTFNGDGGAVNRQVSETQVVKVNTDGADAFGFAAGDDLFTILRQAAAAIRADDQGTARAAIGRLEKGHTRVLDALERVGNAGVSVENTLKAGAAQELTLKEARSALVDTDLAKATLDMQLSSVAYQAALAAIAQSNLPSLADYLR